MGTFNLDMDLFKPEMGTFKIVMDRINFFSFRLFIVCERSVRNPIVFSKKKLFNVVPKNRLISKTNNSF